MARILTARGESLAAFDGRCIPTGCVAPPSNTLGILGRRALPAGRLARLGATPDFHRGLLRVARGCLFAFTCLTASSASAQQAAGIAGSVGDPSGSMIPGVTVEASSDALIEKARTVVTDGEGRYRIVDLRPGSYTVTFTLPGFTTVRRDGVLLTAGFTATINAELRIGSLEETITVAGASPLVDTQNTVAQQVVSGESLSVLPSSSKAMASLVNLIPGVSMTPDVGGSSGIFTSNQNGRLQHHGKGGVKISYDGMNVLNMNAGGVSYIVNQTTAVEITVQASGTSAESTASGVLINLIPKEGGNAFKGMVDGIFTNSSLQSDNLTDELRARGLTTGTTLDHLYDSNVSFGGPIRGNKLWFFTAFRASGTQIQVPGVYFNATVGQPLYTPDLSQPAYRRERLLSQAERVTWQVSPRNKLNLFADTQGAFIHGRGGFTSPEAATGYDLWPNGLYQAKWTSPLTNKLLLETGFSWMNGPSPTANRDKGLMTVNRNNISTTNLSTGFIYNAKPFYSDTWDNVRIVEQFSATYVTGSHAVKAGMQVEEGISNQLTEVQRDVNYGFLGTVPNRITQYATPYLEKERMLDLSFYVQDQWSINRLTINYGLRFNRFYGWVPPQDVPAGQFVGARSFQGVSAVPSWKDLNPRLGLAYDLFGNGRTAVKMSLGRYNDVTATLVPRASNPIETSVNSVTRTWTDANRDYVPDCDLNNQLANAECGQISNLSFGRPNITTTYSPDVLTGWGVRNYSWDFAAEVQHQLTDRIALKGGYFHSRAGNFQVTDNLLLTPADHASYCITAPTDPRLPNGGGYQVCGLYDVSPAKFGLVNNLVNQASNYIESGSGANCGAQGGSFYVLCGQSDFFSVSVDKRFDRGIQFGGGVDTGRTVRDTCFVVDSPQQLLNCRVVRPFHAQTQVKLFGSYSLPGAVMVSGMLQNTPGAPIEANYTATNAEILPSLGRNLGQCRGAAVCTASVSGIPLIAPMTRFEDRRTQLDLRVSKVVKVGRSREFQVHVDVYNVLNGSTVLNSNGNYGPSWLLPISPAAAADPILMPRLVEFGGQFRF